MDNSMPSDEESCDRQRMYWRCRRGMLELDVLLVTFMAHGYGRLTPELVRALETLLEYPDALLLDLLMGKILPADPKIGRVVEQIRSATAA